MGPQDLCVPQRCRKLQLWRAWGKTGRSIAQRRPTNENFQIQLLACTTCRVLRRARPQRSALRIVLEHAIVRSSSPSTLARLCAQPHQPEGAPESRAPAAALCMLVSCRETPALNPSRRNAPDTKIAYSSGAWPLVTGWVIATFINVHVAHLYLTARDSSGPEAQSRFQIK